MTAPKMAGIYARISRDRAGDRLGVGRQETECRALAERLGANVVDIYVDDDVSAYHGRPRLQFDRLLADVQAGVIDTIIAWHPDRLTRSPRELEDFIDIVEGEGCGVETVQAGRYDLSTRSGRTTARLIGAVARDESEAKAERLRSKHDELARAGKWSGGPPPFGYRSIGGGTLQVDEAQAAVVREAAERILNGETLHAVCAALNEGQVPAAKGGTWRTPTLRDILTSTRIYGHREHQGEDMGPAVWEPILDREVVERLRRVLRDPVRRRPTPARVSLLAGGLARCGHCGSNLQTQRNSRGSRVYMCRKPPSGDGCGSMSVAADRADETVAAAVIAAVCGPSLDEFVVDAERDPHLAQRLADDEARLEELAADWGNGDITRPEWQAARDAVLRRIDEARAQLAGDGRSDALKGLPTDREQLSAAWATWTLDRQRAVTAAVIDHVVVRPATTRGRTFDRRRVLDGIEWRA